MKFGSIFEAKTGMSCGAMSTAEISKVAIKKPQFKTYGGILIPSQDFMFKKKIRNIDKEIDAILFSKSERLIRTIKNLFSRIFK